MKIPKPLNKMERDAVDSAFRTIREEWGLATSFRLPELLKKWCRFVQELEVGYQLSIHDFIHDISMRDLIEEIGDSSPPRLRQEIEKFVTPWDERYFRATRPTRRPIDGDCDSAREWWFRIPLVFGQELQEDFLREGLLSE